MRIASRELPLLSNFIAEGRTPDFWDVRPLRAASLANCRQFALIVLLMIVAGAVTESEIPERDLSVQLSGWMLMEAAHAVTNNERTTDE